MEIQLHGYLKELHPAPIKVEASTVAEAISALQLIPAFNPRTSKKKHTVIIEGFNSADALYDRDAAPTTINVHPVVIGAGSNGLGQIILGAIIIAVAWWNPLGWGALTVSNMYMAGAMMILGGILQMMAPQPEFNNDTARSRYLGQGRNTTAIGTRIPIIIGRRKAHGHYLSFDMDSGDLNSAPESWYSSPFTDFGELTYAAAPADTPMLPPSEMDSQPTSNFIGLAYPEAMGTAEVVYVDFFPLVDLEVGQWDISFLTGQTLHVMNVTAGMTGRVTVLGGSVAGLPPTGTGIVFTRNYG